MELIVLAVIIFAVYKTVRARRKNAREAEESRKKFAELNKLSPEEERAAQAWSVYRNAPSEAAMRLLEEAAAADTNHWNMDFLMGIRCDTGIDGVPVDRERAQSWYERALAKAKSYGSDRYVKDMETFLDYYRRPYGNFQRPDSRVEQTRRLETALLLCVGCADGSGGVLRCNMRGGVDGYALDFSAAMRIIRQMPGHSPMVLRLLEDYDAIAKSNPILGMQPEERRERFHGFLKLLPNTKHLSAPGTDYHCFLYGLLIQTNNTPYYGLLKEFIESDLKFTMETAYVKYFAWAIEAGSAEGMYMQFQELDAFRRVYRWDDSRAASHCRDVFLEYTGNKGWDDGAKWLAEKFYPGAEKDEWVFD